VTQAWTTTNLLRTQVELENLIAKGLKLDLAGTLNPAKSQKAAILTAIYKQPSLHTRATVDLFKGPTFTADTVIGRDGFLVGAEASYDVTSGAITRYAGAVGFSAPEYAVTLHGLGNLSTFSASYYHKVSKDVEAGAKAIYDTKSTLNGVSLEVGAKTYLDNAAFIKTKINNSGVLCLGYTQALRPGVKAAFGLALDTTRINDPTAGQAAHKVGASITFADASKRSSSWMRPSTNAWSVLASSYSALSTVSLNSLARRICSSTSCLRTVTSSCSSAVKRCFPSGVR